MKTMMIVLALALGMSACQKPGCIYEHKVQVIDSNGVLVPYKYNYDTVFYHTAWYGSVELSAEEIAVIKDIYVHQSFGGHDVIVEYTGGELCNQ